MPWSNVGHLAGPPGATGPQGPTRGAAVFTGDTPPSDAEDGDVWIGAGAIRVLDGDWTVLALLAPYAHWNDLFNTEGGN